MKTSSAKTSKKIVLTNNHGLLSVKFRWSEIRSYIVKTAKKS